jgi:diguanylate cyclase (GGDEF)-like protein
MDFSAGVWAKDGPAPDEVQMQPLLESHVLMTGLAFTIALALLAVAATRGLRLRTGGAPRSPLSIFVRVCLNAALLGGAVSALRIAVGLALGDAAPTPPWDLLLRTDVIGVVAVALIIAFVETEVNRSWLLLGASFAAALTWAGASWLEPFGVTSPLEPLPAAFVAAVLCTLMLSAGPLSRLVGRVHRDAVHEAFDHLVVGDSDGRILYVSDAGRTALGLGVPPAGLFGGTDRLPKSLRELLGNPAKRKVRLRTRSGRMFEAQTTELLSRGLRKNARGIAVRDVTGAYLTKRRLVRLAHYDSLTGLANRRLLLETIANVVTSAQEKAHRAALFYIDLDDFKTINDTLGHAAGDAMLKLLAQRLLTELRPEAVARLGIPANPPLTVARLAGDEFAVIAPKVADSEVAAELARWILEVIRRPIDVSDRVVTPSASVGLAMFPEDARDVDTLLRRADSALYVAKSRGRHRHARYEASFEEQADRARRIEDGLRVAIERGELRLFYQPKVDTATGVLVGLEALLRWRSPDIGDVGPAEFIPVAEERGLITAIGTWCLGEACRQIRAWNEAGLRTVPVSVNVSSRQFHDSDLQRVVSDALRAHDVDPQQLELELTESLLLDERVDVELVLRDLRSVGVRIALDDFGTGYSALSYLNRFSLDVLKMDRALLRDIDSNPSALGVVSAVVSMSHSLGLTVVAEGVDMDEQLQILHDLGCDQIQGFLFSPALPPDELAPYLGRADGAIPVYGPGMSASGRASSANDHDDFADAPALRDGIEFEEDGARGIEQRGDRGRALLVDDACGSLGPLALRLGHLGTEIHYASETDEAHLFVGQEADRIRLLIAPPTLDFKAGREVLDNLTQVAGRRQRFIVIGERPADEVREKIREAGVDWVLWSPFNDAELRYLVRNGMALPENIAERREARVPVDFVARIKNQPSRAVAVVSSLSARGAFIELSNPPAVGSQLKIEIDLLHDQFRGFARVVYLQTDEPSGIGVTFYGTSRDDERMLRKTVKEIESRYLP